jgi:hypothetical protein
MNAKHLGSDFDAFLRKEDMLDEAEAGRQRRDGHAAREVPQQRPGLWLRMQQAHDLWHADLPQAVSRAAREWL